MCGTITGSIIDKFDEPIRNKRFLTEYQWTEHATSDFIICTDDYGEYSLRALSKPTSLNQIYFLESNIIKQLIPISSINYTLEPDSCIERNIYLLDSLETGIIEDFRINNPFLIYPNPVHSSEILTIEIDLPVHASNIWIEYMTLEGKLIKKEKITNKLNYIDPPISNGAFLLQILVDQQLICTKKILVINE